jgi:hypothetical protein
MTNKIERIYPPASNSVKSTGCSFSYMIIEEKSCLIFSILIGFSKFSQIIPTSKMRTRITTKVVIHLLGFLKWYNCTVTFLIF